MLKCCFSTCSTQVAWEFSQSWVLHLQIPSCQATQHSPECGVFTAQRLELSLLGLVGECRLATNEDCLNMMTWWKKKATWHSKLLLHASSCFRVHAATCRRHLGSDCTNKMVSSDNPSHVHKFIIRSVFCSRNICRRAELLGLMWLHLQYSCGYNYCFYYLYSYAVNLEICTMYAVAVFRMSQMWRMYTAEVCTNLSCRWRAEKNKN